MTIAQGITKTLAYKKQSALGTAASGSGGQKLRRENSVFTLAKATYENMEIVSSQQSTGVTLGVRGVTGKLSGFVSPSTYAPLIGSLLRKDFAAVAAVTGVSLTIAASGSAYTVTRASGSYLTDGFKVGDVIQLTVGALNAANITKNLLITAIGSATVITVIPVNAVALVAEGPITGCTVTVIGKKSYTPTSGHTNDYYTFEDWYNDVSASETFTDVQIAKADIGIPATGNATIAIDTIGLNRTQGASQVFTSPTAETSTGVVQAVNGVVVLTGTKTVIANGASITIDGTLSPIGAVIGSNISPDIQKGRVKVSGQVTVYFDGGSTGYTPAAFDTGAINSLLVVLAVDSTAASKFVAFAITALKLTSDTPDDGEKAIVRTYSFTGQSDTAGGAALATNQTIITVQDSDA